MVLYCKDCKNMITSPRYKYLYINNKKTNIIICVECYITYYMSKPCKFKERFPDIYKHAYRQLYV